MSSRPGVTQNTTGPKVINSCLARVKRRKGGVRVARVVEGAARRRCRLGAAVSAGHEEQASHERSRLHVHADRGIHEPRSGPAWPAVLAGSGRSPTIAPPGARTG